MRVRGIVACENIRFSSLFAAKRPQRRRARRNGCFRRLEASMTKNPEQLRKRDQETVFLPLLRSIKNKVSLAVELLTRQTKSLENTTLCQYQPASRRRISGRRFSFFFFVRDDRKCVCGSQAMLVQAKAAIFFLVTGISAAELKLTHSRRTIILKVDFLTSCIFLTVELYSFSNNSFVTTGL